MPKATPVLLLYFSYLWINIRLVPKMFGQEEEGKPSVSFPQRIARWSRRHPLQLVTAIILYVLLSICLSISAHRSELVNPFRRGGNMSGFYMATALWLGYGIYVIVREILIDNMERSGERQSYFALIANSVTTFVMGITLLLKLADLLGLIDHWRNVLLFYVVLLVIFFIGMMNVYWLYPKYARKKFINVPLLLRQVLLTGACSVVLFALFEDHDAAPYVILWFFEFFIVTPVSWLVYQYRKDKILQMRGMQEELIKSRSNLAFLRAQINPHFLFNALNTLYGTALQENADRTAEGVQKLGDMMRFMLHENNMELIQMSREIDYLENYISLQKLRTATSPSIVIEHDIQAGHCAHSIAPMLLIPFVENAFKHGISLQEKSWIKIQLRCEAGLIYFETRNSVHTRTAGHTEEGSSGIGLNNVRERLRWLYPGRHELTINGNDSEFVVKLVLRP
ncbi:MAG: histidine kinase [Bacteroidetes bacterium]|nr:histidine kinase [Bacteroidota bacterium]